jgi:hypothetical protein
MALDLTILNGIGDGAADGNASFQGDLSGNAGQILAGDNAPTSIFQSELEGLGANTTIVLQANGSISLDPSLIAINFANLTGGGGGNISFIADFDNNGVGSYSGGSAALNASGRNLSISGAEVSANGINTLNSSSENSGNGGAIALNSYANISTSSLASYSVVYVNGTAGNGGAIPLNSSSDISTS